MAGSGLQPMKVTKYYPMLLLDWLMPIYDLFARHFTLEKLFKPDLIALTRTAPGHCVLDLSISCNLDGLLPYLFQDSEFANVAESNAYATISGTVSILSGQKPCVPIPSCQ